MRWGPTAPGWCGCWSSDGTLQGLRYGADGTLAVLATAGAHKEPGATQAAAKMAGEIGVDEDEQRIATIRNNALHYESPADLYVYGVRLAP